MQNQPASFFAGLTEEEVATILAGLERRRFPAGATVMAEGDAPRDVYIVAAGTADAFITDRAGREHLVGHIGTHATLGEMSVFTGQPASATVRATTDLDVLVLPGLEFHRTAAAYPQIYRNLGAILSERLARSNRRALRDTSGRAVALLDYGAPPLLGYALACSVAWHTRAATLLLVVHDGPPPRELTALAVPAGPAARARAETRVVEPRGVYAPASLHLTVEELCTRYDHVLVQLPSTGKRPAFATRSVRIAGLRDPDAPAGPAFHTVRGWADPRRPARPDKEGVLRVPQLTPADERALQDGVLPSSTPMGTVLGWAARDITGLQVGLALGAGGDRGYAHLGALTVLEKAGRAD